MSRTITGHTSLTCLLGSPTAHSLSPIMHNEAFERLGLDYAYLAFDVNESELKTAIEGLRAMKVRGFNLTMPNKNLMCKLCDRLSPVAQITGAVNTVVNDNGIFTGYTTDGVGYMQAAREEGCNIIGEKITVLGAGGAAAAIIAQAAFDGVSEISVFNGKSSSYERMEEIISKLRRQTSCRLNLHTYNSTEILRREISESTLLVNTTPVGMAPNTDASIITDPSMFHKDLTVSDIIYNPKETKFLCIAKEAGCQTFNGLYMLLYQGAEAFRLWTGHEMPVDVIKEKYFK